jgi:hypothetical protein
MDEDMYEQIQELTRLEAFSKVINTLSKSAIALGTVRTYNK